ncbi:MAG: glycosyltransferase family 4 protein [Victivallaceae bacterium]|nr:glycosyltransferase family 4 protein [Victivallaceae bacterium]
MTVPKNESGKLKRPKVLLLTSELSPYRLPLFNELTKRVDLTVWLCGRQSKNRKWKLLLEEYPFRKKFLMSFRAGPLMINPTLPAELLRNNYDLYILSDDQRIFFSESVAFAIAKMLRRPVIVWSGGWDENYYESYKNLIDRLLLRPVSRLYYRFTDGFIAYGQRTRNYLEKKGVPARKIFTGTQFVPPARLTEADKRSCASALRVNAEKLAGRKVVLSVGSFSKRKGFDDLIETYKELDFSDTALVLGGAGEDEEKLKRLAAGRKDIHFVGYLEGADKAYYYSLADIFVFPTYSDAWGLVTNEAMMFGLPVITTEKAGCADELIDGSGFVVTAGDRRALRKKLELLLKSDELRKQMGKRSEQIIKNYDLEMARKTFVNAINHVMRKD